MRNYAHETSFGLPSGHAQIAASVWGWLAFEVKKRWFTVVTLILIFMIGISRIYLGVHFLTDVLLGWLLGGLFVWAFAAWKDPVGQWINNQSQFVKFFLVIASTLAMVLLIFGARWVVGPWVIDSAWEARAGEVDPYNLDGIFTLAGTWMGMLSGFVLLVEKKGYFKAGEGGWRRFVRLIVGLVGIIVLYSGLGQIFPRNADCISFALRFVRYTLIGLWVSWLAPVFFERIGILEFES